MGSVVFSDSYYVNYVGDVSAKVQLTFNESYTAATNTSQVTLSKIEVRVLGNTNTYSSLPLYGVIKLAGTTVATIDNTQSGKMASVTISGSGYCQADISKLTITPVNVVHNADGTKDVTVQLMGGYTPNSVDGTLCFAAIYEQQLTSVFTNEVPFGVRTGQDGVSGTMPLTSHTRQWTVSYDANGGSGAPSAQTKTYGVTLTLSSTQPTKSSSTDATYTITYNYNGNGQSSTTATANKTTSYSFSKWNTAENGSGTNYNPGGSYTANAAAILYAQWTSSTSTSSVTLPSPTRTGYTFAGWYDAASGGTKIGNGGASYTPTATKTLYAHWTINSYTVTCKDYVGNTSGTLLGTKTGTYDYGTSVSGASFGSNTAYDAYYTGYHYTSSSSAVTVTGAKTVYRYFALNTWTISYNDNTGNSALAWYGMTVTNMPSSQTKTYGSNTTLSSKVPVIAAEKANGSFTVTYDSRGGSVCSASTANKTMSFAFSNWYASPQKVSYSPGDTYSTNADTVMYAQFSKTDHTASVTLPTTTREGYTFSGWYTAASGGNKVGNAGASYTPTADVTLYAHWTANSYTVKFNKNNSSATGSTADEDFTYGVAKALTSNGFSLTGYDFKGWAETASGAVKYTDGQSVKNLTATNNGTVNLYAVWEIKHYSVSYNANSGSSTPSTQNFDYGGSVKLSAAISRSNASAGSYTVTYKINYSGGTDPTAATAARTTKYTFSGWKASTDSTVYAASSTYSKNASVTMTAQWSSTTTTASVTLPSPTRTGYTFKGWSTSSSATTGSTGNYTPSGNVTLYAVWQLKTYTLSISQGTGSTISVTRGGTALANGATISHFDVLTISISANTGYNLGTHTVNGSTWTSGSQLTVSGAVTVVSSATKKTYKLTVTKSSTGVVVNVNRSSSPIGGGSIGLLNSGATLYYNDVIKVSYEKNAGYNLTAATVNGATIPVKSTNIGETANITVTANQVVVVTVEQSAVVYIGNGTSFDQYQIFIGDGTNWNQYQAYIGDGTNWVAY